MHRLYDLSLTNTDWAGVAARLLLPELGGDGPGRFVALERGHLDVLALDASDDEGYRMATGFPLVAPRDLHARMARRAITSVTHASLWTDATRQFLAELRAKDAVVISCMNDRGGLVVGRLVGRTGRQPNVESGRARPLAKAIGLAYRARCAACGLEGGRFAAAVLTSEGTVVARDRASMPESALDVLRTAVRARERAVHRPVSSGDPTSLWPNLVCGRWSLLDDYEEGGRRYVIAVPTGPGERQRIKLTTREARALELCIHGQSVKSAAAELGVPPSTVYALQHRALTKLGARSVADLVGLVRAKTETVLARFECGAETLMAIGLSSSGAENLAGLTEAERAILPLVLAAKPHTEIAVERETSPRTVANQIASIYRKFRVSGRVELALQLAKH